MRPLLVVVALLAGCVTSSAGAPVEVGPGHLLVQANLAGGWADGAEVDGVDDVVVALADAIQALPREPLAVFLNESCESHGAHLASLLGPQWSRTFVRVWDNHSDCFPAPDSSVGQAGNTLLVRGPIEPFRIPSCNEDGTVEGRCLPNWAWPAEQRRGACATTPVDGLRIALCSVHLDPKRWEPHDAQVDALGEIATALEIEHPVVVIGGDLNEGRPRIDEVAGWVHLTGSRRLRTLPAGRPRRDVDHLLALGAARAGSAGWTVDLGHCERTFREDGRCTDHLALVGNLVVG